MSAEEAFDDIAQETCQKAAKVKCSAEEYREGLRHIISELQVAHTASEEC